MAGRPGRQRQLGLNVWVYLINFPKRRLRISLSSRRV
jgi:hypothetical protein